MNLKVRNSHFCNLHSYAGSPVDAIGNVTDVQSDVQFAGTQIALLVVAATGWFTLLGVVVIVILRFCWHKKKQIKEPT